jgi:hypothetical protein
VNCSQYSLAAQIQPFGDNNLPIDNGWFGDYSDTSTLGGTIYTMVWVATDDQNNETTQTINIPINNDDGIPEKPVLSIDCNGDTDGEITITAGDKPECTVSVRDNDPGDIDVDISTVSGSPSGPDFPASVDGSPLFSIDWVWYSKDPADKGKTVVFRFTADDGTFTVSLDLTVHAQ